VSSAAAFHAVRIGLQRGWIMFRHVITTADGIWNTVIWNGIPLAILILNRNEVVEGTDLSLAVVALPGFLGLMIAASAIGPAYYLAAEREDGTVLRAKAVPHGIVGYVTGVLTQASLETFLGIALILIPGFILFPGLVVDDPLRWTVFVIFVVLGLLAVLPAGVVIGSLVRSPRLVGGLAFLIIGGMAVVSGILIPLQTMPQWVQLIGQVLPTYWIGVGMRFVFLPDAAAVIEIGQTWRLLEATTVLGLWALGGILVAPAVLRRMARRESGASVEASRQEALQRM
jgi:ABC-2 type transport system permease protein